MDMDGSMDDIRSSREWPLMNGRMNGAAHSGLGECDAGLDIGPIPPRGWLLGNVFCREFVSSIIADGGVGKTALRIAQLLSLACGRSLVGDHVFQRCRVLFLSLEDDEKEVRRRIRAAQLHHGVTPEEIRGWFYYATVNRDTGKLMALDERGRPARSVMADKVESTIVERQIDVLCFDPFIKSHGLEENSNNEMDLVMQLLTEFAARHNAAIDIPHHVNKGPAEAGNANRGRGASAVKDAARLVFTLTQMASEEAESFGISEAERRSLVRMDSGKVNIAPPLDKARWFRLVGVRLNNGTEDYPQGDEVQTVEAWTPPDAWEGLSHHLLNHILTNIDAGMDDGERYSHAPNALDRAAWQVVAKHAPGKTEKQARAIIRTWMKTGTLQSDVYHSEADRKDRKGLRVNDAKRPS
ncbi:MAG: AAA family ATPase [Proteobacteria bacterium]|nr:AAA family ATPase [Pseudomonadota bacterium]